MDIPENEIKKLKEEVKETNVKLERMTSFKYAFLLSIVRGVGTVLGATIVATIVFALLSWVTESIGGVPFIEWLLEESRD